MRARQSNAMYFILVLSLVFVLNAPGALVAGEAERACLNAADTRAAIIAHNLADPLPALRAAARKGQAEPLRLRLCRWNDRFVYETPLLRPDGKIIRVFIDATNGVQTVSAP